MKATLLEDHCSSGRRIFKHADFDVDHDHVLDTHTRYMFDCEQGI